MEGVHEPASLWQPSLRWTTFGALVLVLLAAFEAMAVMTVMPEVARDLDGESLYAVAFSATLAASVIAMVVAGRWSDRSGPTPPLLTAVGLFLAGLLVAGTATSMPVLVGGRFLQGLGSGAITVTLYVVVARRYPPRLHPRVFGLFAAAWVVPSMVGPFLAGVIADTLSWHWVFLGVAVLVLPALALLAPSLAAVSGPATSPEASGGAQAGGGAVLDDRVATSGGAAADDRVATSGGAASSSAAADGSGAPPVVTRQRSAGVAVVLAVVVALGLVLTGSLADLAAGPTAWLAAAALLAIVALAVRPLLPARTLRARRGLPATILLRGVIAAAYFGTEVYLPLMLQREYGMSASAAGLVLTVGAISWSSGSAVQARLGLRVASERLLVIGSSIVVVAVGLQVVTALADLGPAGAMVAWLIGGFGMGLAYPRITTIVLALSAPREQGFNSSALSISDAVGGSAATAVTGLVFAAVGGGLGAFAACFSLCLVLAVVGVGIARRAQRVGAGVREGAVDGGAALAEGPDGGASVRMAP